MSAPEILPTPGSATTRRFTRKQKSVRVLVISPSGFVRLAIAHRLADIDAVVTLSVEGSDVPFDDYDAVVVGPYLDEVDRDKVVDDLITSGSHAALIEICDPPENGSARLIALGDNRLADTAQHLLAAVGDTHGALTTQ